MPWIRRYLLLGLLPMVFFTSVSYGRDAKFKAKNCDNLLGNIQQQRKEARQNMPAARFPYESTRWHSQILNEQFVSAPAPEQRGMDAVTDANLRRWTQGSGLAVFLIDPNPHAHKYARDTIHEAKPAYMKKCKSVSDGPESVRGLVACHPMFFQSEADWKKTKEELATKNLFVDEDNYYLVYSMDYSRDKKNGEKKYFFSDIDLFAVFKMMANGARPYFRNRMINQINRAIDLDGRNGIQHGPRQDYHGKADLGFKFPVTAYIPGVSQPLHIRDVCELKKLYDILNMSVETIWSDHLGKNDEVRRQFQLCSGR